MTHDDLDETSRVMDLALDAREALGTPSLLPADWAPPEPAPLDVLRTWGPCPLALDRATERLTDTLDGSWFADDELACLLDDLLHAVSRYRLDVLRVLDDSAHANRAVLAWPRRPSPGSATPGRRGRAVPR